MILNRSNRPLVTTRSRHVANWLPGNLLPLKSCLPQFQKKHTSLSFRKTEKRPAELYSRKLYTLAKQM